MPKVNEQYFETKRNQILDAALKVCIKKPLYEVTMKDIIEESNVSQGGIYRYFENIDDIFCGIINRAIENIHMKEHVDKILSSHEPPEKVLFDIFRLISKTIAEDILGYSKVFYELINILISDKERYACFSKKISLPDDNQYLQQRTVQYVTQKIDEGYFKPKLPLHEIFLLLVVSIDGIERDVILSRFYNLEEFAPLLSDLDCGRLMNSLCVSCILMLGGDISLCCETEHGHEADYTPVPGRQGGLS